ncbi:MAG: response regulator receiver protein [Candidatus Binatus sp.]|jgi:two-component system chemotaxis response regulator CheY|nr:response regulator receiver protein [Candidatus Binatus sp.]
MTVRVLIADRSGITRDIIRHHLECGGCDVVAETETVNQALDLFRTTQPNVVTLDTGLTKSGGLDAIALFRIIRKEAPTTSVVMLSANSSLDDQHVYVREGALDCVVEPFDSAGLERMWRRLSAIYPELKRNDQMSSGR